MFNSCYLVCTVHHMTDPSLYTPAFGTKAVQGSTILGDALDKVYTHSRLSIGGREADLTAKVSSLANDNKVVIVNVEPLIWIVTDGKLTIGTEGPRLSDSDVYEFTPEIRWILSYQYGRPHSRNYPPADLRISGDIARFVSIREQFPCIVLPKPNLIGTNLKGKMWDLDDGLITLSDNPICFNKNDKFDNEWKFVKKWNETHALERPYVRGFCDTLRFSHELVETIYSSVDPLPDVPFLYSEFRWEIGDRGLAIYASALPIHSSIKIHQIENFIDEWIWVTNYNKSDLSTRKIMVQSIPPRIYNHVFLSSLLKRFETLPSLITPARFMQWEPTYDGYTLTDDPYTNVRIEGEFLRLLETYAKCNKQERKEIAHQMHDWCYFQLRDAIKHGCQLPDIPQ